MHVFYFSTDFSCESYLTIVPIVLTRVHGFRNLAMMSRISVCCLQRSTRERRIGSGRQRTSQPAELPWRLVAQDGNRNEASLENTARRPQSSFDQSVLVAEPVVTAVGGVGYARTRRP
jgi:hypothetical protein